MSTDAARVPGPLRRSALATSLRSGPWLPGITGALLLIALFVLAAAGMGHPAVPRPLSLPSDGPPPRMAAAPGANGSLVRPSRRAPAGAAAAVAVLWAAAIAA